MNDMELSAKTLAVMQLIAKGHSYEQIVSSHPDLTYRDIFDGAAEVVAASRETSRDHMAQLKQRHRRAYEAWTDEEEEQLRRLIDDGHTIARIAGRLERNRGAIRSRIVRLGLVNRLEAKERDRLQRLMGQSESGVK